MNEVLRKLLLLIGVISLFSSVGALIPANADSKDTQDSRIIVSTKLKDVSQSDIERVKKEAEIALNSIPPILGVEYKKDIKIKIVDKGSCKITNGIVLLPLRHVKNKRAPIIHKVSQLIVKKPSRPAWEGGVDDRFFRVGLAVFFQDKFGEDKEFFNYKEPSLSLNDLVIMHRDNLFSLYYLNHKTKIFGYKYKIKMFGKKTFWKAEPKNRKIAYIEAGSFISFLYEKYGDQKFKDLYKTSLPADYEKVYGKSIQELENEWLNYVFVELSAKEQKD